MRDIPRLRPPLVGRQEHLERMMARLSSVLAGEGHVLLITGEAGSGKTRLAEEFEAMVSNVPCLRVGAECAVGSPAYVPFRELLSSLSDHDPSLRARPPFQLLFPPAGQHEEAPAGGENEEGVLFAALDAFRSASEGQPLVLRVEDLHLADARTIQMLHFLARGLVESRVLLIVTYSDDELFDRMEHPHPLIETIRIMKREGLCEEIQLLPLSQEEMAEALGALLEMELEPKALELLHRESGGNPQIAVELTLEGLRSGGIVLGPGKASMEPSRPLGIPSSLREWIGWKLESLPEGHLGMLECAALCGEDFDVDLLSRAMEAQRLEVLELLDAAVRRYRLYVEEGDGYRFRWGAVRRVAVERIPPERALFLRSAIERARETNRTQGCPAEEA